jgi:hypothetical protein
VSWLRIFKKNDDEPARADPVTPRPAPAKVAPKVKTEPTTGYGANPYDTYTWELHTEPDGERELKRAHLIDKRAKEDGESFNPYDTGKFSGGW